MTPKIINALTNLLVILNILNQINFLIMEEKKITEAQSLEIITEMIARSNVRRQLGNGNIMHGGVKVR